MTTSFGDVITSKIFQKKVMASKYPHERSGPLDILETVMVSNYPRDISNISEQPWPLDILETGHDLCIF